MKVAKYQPTLSLKPTQFSIGLMEVEFRVIEFHAMKRRKLAKMVRQTAVPIVVSPWKELCISDRHHFVFACWHADVQEVRVEVVKDYSRSNLSYHKFWRKMAKARYAYLYDQFGDGPRSPLYLPTDIRGMADDPYRSLAWMIRKEGGFENARETFAEFQWANFFRERRLLDSHGRSGFHAAIKRGLRMSRSTEAKALPGFKIVTPKTLDKEKEMLIKSKYVPEERKKGEIVTRAIVK